MFQFAEKYSVWATTAIGGIVALVLIFNWSAMPVLQKTVGLYSIALAFHEWEELRFPGGFVELATSATGLKIKNLGFAKLVLFLFTVYATVIPLLISQFVWPCLGTMLIGCIELFAHLVAARLNQKHFYSPGLITAAFLQFPISCYGLYYMISNALLIPIHWLWAILFLLVPLFAAQALIVKTSGMKYADFIKNARHSFFGSKH